jgi:hypothetical protein
VNSFSYGVDSVASTSEVAAEVAPEVIAAAAAAGKAKGALGATLSGAAGTIFGLMTQQGVATAIGVVLAVCGFALTWYYNHKRARLERDMASEKRAREKKLEERAQKLFDAQMHYFNNGGAIDTRIHEALLRSESDMVELGADD